MSKLFIENSTLTAIGDAIREKTGKTALIAPGAMPAEIKSIVSGGGSGDGDCNGLHVPEEALVISGNCSYRFAQDGWNWFIEEYGDKITTKDITNVNYMFSMANKLTNIPFELNLIVPSAFSNNDLSNMFYNCHTLSSVPAIKNATPQKMSAMFESCRNLKSIPDDLTDTWNWDPLENMTSSYDGYMSGMFLNCHNLRSIPTWFFLHTNPRVYYTYSAVNGAFNMCLTLERVEGIRLPTYATWTGNAFSNTFKECSRLKSVTFALQEDGSPYVHNISNQTIDLTTVGYVSSSAKSYWDLYIKDITEDDIIDSWQKWETYFGDTGHPSSLGTGNGYATSVEWCTFGRTAAKRLFATLPDVTGGSGNTIKLNSRALLGNNQMPYEAINDLTEEEIAVATARGWTVTKA